MQGDEYIKILDAGENSILVNVCILAPVKGFSIRYDYDMFIHASEIISTEQGTIMYFKEDISSIFKKGMVLIVTRCTPSYWFYARTAEFNNKER